MSKTVTIRKRRGYLIPIEGSELEGRIVRGWKYVSIRQRENYYTKKPFSLRFPLYDKKVRVWPCVYCGNESHYLAIFHYSGYDRMERLCPKCVKVYGPIPSEINDDSVPVCNLL